MQLYITDHRPELELESLRELAAAYRAVDDYYPNHSLVRPADNAEVRRLTIREVIMAGDDITGELLHYPFKGSEVGAILAALTIRALESPPSWEQANAQDMLATVPAELLGQLVLASV